MLCVPLNTNLISLNPNPRDSKRIMKTAFSTRGNSAPRPHHLAESGVIFGCHNWVGGGSITGINWVLSREAAKILQHTGQPLQRTSQSQVSTPVFLPGKSDEQRSLQATVHRVARHS